ncbi:MAG: hypothetical protein ACJA0J_001347, partial [Bdellovibrionota bacterium]
PHAYPNHTLPGSPLFTARPPVKLNERTVKLPHRPVTGFADGELQFDE